jgi:hypothetical protein
VSLPRWKRVVRALAVLAGLALVGLAGFSVWIERNAFAPEPDLGGIQPAIANESVRVEKDGTTRLGKASSLTHRGVRYLYLAGPPFELGYENARLSQDVLERQEDVLYRSKDAFVPSRVLQWILRKVLLFMGRGLPEFVPEKRKLEVLGLARGSKPDRHADDAPLYHRVLHYHAIHDYVHLLMDNPVVYGHWDELRTGCSAFAATSEATRDRHVLLARDFDMELGRIFDEEKVVLVVNPESGIPFVSVAWSGMAGAVTGVNRAGIACVLDAAASDDDAFTGEPISFVVRDVLERAHTLDEAVAIIRDARVFVSDDFVLASAGEDRAVVVEKSPRRCAVRQAEGGLVLATNHFLCPEFSGDKANGKRRRDATTEERFARLTELVAPLRGSLSVPSCVSVLRDRRGPQGKDIGLGNRAAIDALIATHSVVIDATARTLWVAAAPHTLGPYFPVSLESVLEKGRIDPAELDRAAIPADPLLASGGYERHLKKRKTLLAARDALDGKDLDGAKKLAEEARALDPSAYEPEEILARVALAAGDRAAAAAHARAALERFPPFAGLREELTTLSRSGQP